MNISEPDPAWDYYQLWQELHHTKANLDELIRGVGQIEDSTPESDQAVYEKLNGIYLSIGVSLAKLQGENRRN